MRRRPRSSLGGRSAETGRVSRNVRADRVEGDAGVLGVDLRVGDAGRDCRDRDLLRPPAHGLGPPRGWQLGERPRRAKQAALLRGVAHYPQRRTSTGPSPDRLRRPGIPITIKRRESIFDQRKGVNFRPAFTTASREHSSRAAPTNTLEPPVKLGAASRPWPRSLCGTPTS